MASKAADEGNLSFLRDIVEDELGGECVEGERTAVLAELERDGWEIIAGGRNVDWARGGGFLNVTMSRGPVSEMGGSLRHGARCHPCLAAPTRLLHVNEPRRKKRWGAAF
jgi:hypothetical protein